MSLLIFFQWLQDTVWATALRESTLVFPIVEGIHLLTLSVSVGLIVICDLRLLGIAMKHESVSDLLDHLRPWSLAGFTIMFVSGGLLFASEAVKCYSNGWFRWKMMFLLLAGLNALIFNVRYRPVTWHADTATPLGARLAGLFSLILWLLVIAAGRTTAYNL